MRVTVFNKNPFAFQYKLHLDEATIADDDVSGFLKLFLPAAQKADAQQTGGDAKNKAKNMTPLTLGFDQTGPTLAGLGEEIGNLGDLIANQIELYQPFAQRYRSATIQLSKQDSCTRLGPIVNAIHQDAIDTRKKLLDAHASVLSVVKKIGADYSQLGDTLNEGIADATSRSDARTVTVQKGNEGDAIKNLREAQAELKAAQDMRKQLDDLKQSALRLECMYLDFAKNQIGGIQSGVIDPLEQVTANDGNFWRTEAIGPYSNPTDVTIINQRKPVDPAKPLPPAAFPSSSSTGKSASGDSCSKELLTADDFAGTEYYVPAADSGTSEAASSTADKKSSSKSKTASSAKPAAASDDGYESDGSAIVHFGGQRFITAAGVGFGFLPKPEFGRVSGIPTDVHGTPTGTAVTNIVGLKSESDVRITPLFFLHTRLFSLHSPSFLTNEALFATFGIGAQADNLGARSEYMVGISQSLVDQKFFITLGTYIGKQQVLKNGLFPGQDVSAIQGDLPVDQVTHFKFGVAISYRFNIGGSGNNSTDSKTKSDTSTKSGGK
ncbi:MAG: hypothetical protein LAO76_16405 [Acidobacteriia bacterium]|nr:hypothetical protein [Terriglobia bacterium]